MDTGIFIGDKVITTSWDKIWNKPTTLSGYGITDAYTQSDADGRFFRYFGYTADSGDDFTWWQKLGTLAYLNAFPDGVTIKRHTFGQVTSFIAGSSTLQLYSTHSSSDPNDGPNGIQWGEYFEAPAIYQNGYKVWDAGNKRDMFSSMNKAFTAWGNEQVINVEGDANTYYPVVITIDGTKTWNSRISIYKNLGSRTPSYPGNHSNGTSSMWAMYEGRYHGWDGNSGYIVTKYVRQPYANLISKAEHAGNSVGALVVYLRGGGCEYTVCTDYRGGVNVYYERTEISGDSNQPVYVEPTTSVGNQGVLNTTGYDYLVQKAVRLETPRTIFSKPFDGTGNITGGAKFLNICIETDNNGNDSGRGSEINNYVGPLQLQQASPNGIHMCMGGGQVGICTTSPKYTLHVDGVIYAKDGFRETSDIRKKKVLSPHTVSLDDMAYADLFDYTLIDDEKEIVRIGTNAHYWLDKLPQVVTKDNDEYLSLNYGVLGTVCALSVSKYVKQLEDRVTLLENKIASLQ